VVGLLKVMGPQLKRPHADTLNGSDYANMKELRADTAQAVLRAAFAFDPLRKAVLLTGGDKSGINEKRFYKQLIAKADTLYGLHLEKINKQKKRKAAVNDMAKSFDELAKRVMSAKSRARADRRTKELLFELLLSEIRKLAGKSQGELAKKLGIKQPSLSKLENQDDMQISTLKKIIEALGGEVHIVARFPNRSVRIKQFDDSPRPARKTKGLQLV